jgi:hypothetical protein
VRVEHQGEHRELVRALEEAGFRTLRNHLAMRCKVSNWMTQRPPRPANKDPIHSEHQRH